MLSLPALLSCVSRAGAMASLRQYGIDTIDQLREEMIRLGLLSDNLLGKGTMLQVLFLLIETTSTQDKTFVENGS